MTEMQKLASVVGVVLLVVLLLCGGCLVLPRMMSDPFEAAEEMQRTDVPAAPATVPIEEPSPDVEPSDTIPNVEASDTTPDDEPN